MNELGNGVTQIEVSHDTPEGPRASAAAVAHSIVVLMPSSTDLQHVSSDAATPLSHAHTRAAVSVACTHIALLDICGAPLVIKPVFIHSQQAALL